MAELITETDRESDKREPSIWIYIIGVLVSTVMIITTSRFVFNLLPARSDFFYTEKVANEAFKKFSQRLEAISKEYVREIEAKEKEG